MIDTMGTRIERLREKAGMSQTVLAQRLGVSRAGVQSWESGENLPSTENLIALSSLFHVSTDYLLDIHPKRTLCLDNYTNAEQEIIFRFLQYCDETNHALNKKR